MPDLPERKAQTIEPAKRRFTVSEALSDALLIGVREQTKAHEMRMGKILTRFGFERVQERIPKAERDQTTGENRTRRWVYRLAAGVSPS